MTDQEQNQTTASPGGDTATATPDPSPNPAADAAAEAPESGRTIDSQNSSVSGLTTENRADMDMLRDVELSVTAELGRAKLTLGEVTSLTGGSVVTLSKAAGEPADLRINDQLFASGEVIVIDGNFAIKITKLLSKEERMKNFS